LKDLQGWKEAPVDCVVRSLLFQLQSFYLNEVKSRLARLGEYSLLPELTLMKIWFSLMKEDLITKLLNLPI